MKLIPFHGFISIKRIFVFLSHILFHVLLTYLLHTQQRGYWYQTLITGWFGKPSNVLNILNCMIYSSDHINDCVDVPDGLLGHCSKSFQNWYFYQRSKLNSNLIILFKCVMHTWQLEKSFFSPPKIRINELRPWRAVNNVWLWYFKRVKINRWINFKTRKTIEKKNAQRQIKKIKEETETRSLKKWAAFNGNFYAYLEP